MAARWKRGATNVAQLSKFQNAITRGMPDDADVSGALYTTAGVLVPGSEMTMLFEPAYFDAAAGNDVPAAYRGYSDPLLDLPDAEYDLIVTAVWDGHPRPFEPLRIEMY